MRIGPPCGASLARAGEPHPAATRATRARQPRTAFKMRRPRDTYHPPPLTERRTGVLSAAVTATKGPMDQFAAHLDRGWDLVSRGDLAGALLSAQKSLELDAESPEAHNLIGYIHAAEGSSEEALEHYKQAIELDETFVEAMLNAAEVLIHPVRDFDAAIKMIEDALEYAADDEEVADALLLKIDALLHRGDAEEAKRAVAALPEGPFENGHLDFLIG